MTKLIGRLLAILLSGILLALGGFFCVWGGYVALKVFDDYKDSSDSTYLIFGTPLLAIGLILVAAGGFVVLSGESPSRWLMLAGAAFVAGAIPYGELLGGPSYALNFLLLAMALASFGIHHGLSRRVHT